MTRPDACAQTPCVGLDCGVYLPGRAPRKLPHRTPEQHAETRAKVAAPFSKDNKALTDNKALAPATPRQGVRGPAMTPDEIARVAQALTQAQREALFKFTETWAAASEVLGLRIVGSVASILADKGMLERRSDPTKWGRSQYRLSQSALTLNVERSCERLCR